MKNMPFLWSQAWSYKQTSAVGIILPFGKFGGIGSDEEVWNEDVVGNLGVPDHLIVYGAKLIIITGLSVSFPIYTLEDLMIGGIG